MSDELKPLTDAETIQYELSSMGFKLNHIQEALQQFQKKHGDDYNVSTIIDIAIEIKNKQAVLTEQVSNYNTQLIGNELYFKIKLMEPILAGKITGMMLQWNTNILRNLLTDTHQLQQLVNKAKSALDTLPFKPNMCLTEAQNLRPNDKIDFRDTFGKFVHSTVIQKKDSNLWLHCNAVDIWCDCTKELHRFAVSGSISARPAHRLCHLSIGDMVDFNPKHNINLNLGWTCGKVTRLDPHSGQIEVMYEYDDIPITYTAWAHVDNKEEIAVFRTQYEYVDISTNLLHWKALSPNPAAHENIAKLKTLLQLNDNEIIALTEHTIYKYFIRENVWREWLQLPGFICCCFNDDKSSLYLLTNTMTIMEIVVHCASTIVHQAYLPCMPWPQCMIMVQDTIHFFGKMGANGMHFIWKKNMKQAQLIHTLDDLKATSNFLRICGYTNHALVYCKQRNILLLFGSLFGNKMYVYSIKANQWYHRSFLRAHRLADLFGFQITNDEKYILIFPGSLYQWNQVGNICLIDIENTKLITSKTNNCLLSNVLSPLRNINTYFHRAYFGLDDCKLFFPLIVNKTTMLIDGFLRICWQTDEFKTVRLLSGDVISMIKGWFGYDNDELYIYCVYGGYMWNTKVNEIIKHQLPIFKFCCDTQKLAQEQMQLDVLKYQLMKDLWTPTLSQS